MELKDIPLRDSDTAMDLFLKIIYIGPDRHTKCVAFFTSVITNIPNPIEVASFFAGVACYLRENESDEKKIVFVLNVILNLTRAGGFPLFIYEEDFLPVYVTIADMIHLFRNEIYITDDFGDDDFNDF